MSNNKNGSDGTQTKAIKSPDGKTVDSNKNAGANQSIPFNRIDPIQSQREYLKSLSAEVRTSPQLVNAEGFADIAPDLGYKGADYAVFENIDNSIESGADRIDVILDVKGKRTKKAEICNLAIADNGSGILPEMLPLTLCFAHGTHRDNPTDLGKFGMGGPGSARMITDNYTIYSRVKGKEWYAVSYNHSKVKNGEWTDKQGRTIVPTAKPCELPSFVKGYFDDNYVNTEYGTVVVFENPARLENGFKTLKSCADKLVRRLGESYPRHLETVDMFVDGEEVPIIDLTFLSPSGLHHDVGNGVFAESRGSKKIKVMVGGKEGTIELASSYLPRGFSRTDSKQNERFRIMKESNCFINVYRCGRLITRISRLSFPCGLRKSLVNNDRNWVQTLNFSPELDSLFMVSFNKQRISPTQKLWEILEEHEVHLTLKGLWQEVNEEQRAARAERENAKEGSRESDVTMTEAAAVIKGRESLERTREREGNLDEETKKKAEQTGKKPEEVRPEIIAETSKKPYKVVFEHREQAPHYWMNVIGGQTQLVLNTAHSFHSLVYDAPGTTEQFKTQIELMLYSKGLGEIESTGKRALFCEQERYQWSQRLSVVLSVHDERQPIDEEKEAEEALAESEQENYRKAS